MPHKELEAEVICPNCKHVYGIIYRVQIGKDQWAHETSPSSIPMYCGICECPNERKHHG